MTPQRWMLLRHAEQASQVELVLVLGNADIEEAIVSAWPEARGDRSVLERGLGSWNACLAEEVGQVVRRGWTLRADAEAIEQYAQGFRALLWAPPFGPRPVLAILPGREQGCCVAVVDGAGRLVANERVFPLEPRLQVPQTKAVLTTLCRTHDVAVIAIANRDGANTLRPIAETFDDACKLPVTMVDEDDAHVHAIMEEQGVAQDPSTRVAAALCRRVQDPLIELTRAEPRALFLGEFQLDVARDRLEAALEAVLEASIASVGVELGRASEQVLRRVPGLDSAKARKLSNMANELRSIRSRQDLRVVLGESAFEQAAAFLRVPWSDHPLDRSAIHPERYPVVTSIARMLDVTVEELMGNEVVLSRVDRDVVLREHTDTVPPLDRHDLDQLIAELVHPGKDPRPQWRERRGGPGFAELTLGRDVEGVVRKVAKFGALVEIGPSLVGLVPARELAKTGRVRVGDVVTVRIVEIDAERQRFSLVVRSSSLRSSSGDAKPGARTC